MGTKQFTSRQELLDALDAAELGEFLSKIRALIKPCLRVVPADDGALRLGGRPVLRPGTPWPRREALPHAAEFREWMPDLGDAWSAPCVLNFVGVVDLAVAAERFGDEWPLPRDGRLNIFWDPLCGCYGQGVANTRVIWDRSDPAFGVAMDIPLDEYPSVAGAAPVDPERSFDLQPSWSCPDLEGLYGILGLSFRDICIPDESVFMKLYWDRIHIWGFKHGDEVRMLGWSSPIQTDPLLYAIAEREGLSDVPLKWDYVGIERAADADKWVLLLQVGVADTGGAVYFYLTAEDASNGRFDRVHAIYQQT